ncbi:MAG: hypothetical protein D8M59_01765 [Planctomycetes bacterium]|nr:hypothetical protein [Planctomycetota bacterium]NOG54552.1 hypothetical protein [Planctomycetota bacterium]
MGCPLVTQLVRHGVGPQPPGRIWIVDGDVVSQRNLIGTEYRESHVGTGKAAALAGIAREIDSRVNVFYWDRMLSVTNQADVEQLARQSDLLCLVADSFDLMLRIADRCHEHCPQVMAAFGAHADCAEVAFSTPGQNQALRTTLGRETRTAITQPQALGCDTAFVVNFVVALCLQLLTGQRTGLQIVPIRNDAPLYLIGLRRVWLFENQPPDVIRSVLSIGTTPTP